MFPKISFSLSKIYLLDKETNLILMKLEFNERSYFSARTKEIALTSM